MNYEEIKEKISDEITSLCGDIAITKKKIYTLEDNNFENHIMTGIGFGMPVFLLSIIASGHEITPETAATYINVETIAPIIMGYLFQKILYKLRKSKEKLQEFSQSRSWHEIICEKTKYQLIEYGLYNIKTVLESARSSITTRSNNPYIYDNLIKIEQNGNKPGELSAYTEKIRLAYETKKQEIMINSSKYKLSEMFWRQRDNFNKVLDVLLTSVACTGVGAIYFGTPIMLSKGTVPPEYATLYLASTGATTCASIFYAILRQSVYSNAFNKNNENLGKSALPKKQSADELETIEKELNKSIQEAILLKIELEEARHVLSTLEGPKLTKKI